MRSWATVLVLAAAASALPLLGDDAVAEKCERPTAPAILARCRAMLPVRPMELRGSIILRTRKGFVQGEYDFTMATDRTRTPASVALEFRRRGTTNVLERAVVERPGKIPEGRILGTDVAWQDLTLDFLWWQDAEFDPEPEQESVHGQKCDVILAKSGEEAVRLWTDRKTGCLMQAETLSPKGKTVRRLWGTRVKKFNGRWMPNVLEAETLGSGHRTKIKIDEVLEEGVVLE